MAVYDPSSRRYIADEDLGDVPEGMNEDEWFDQFNGMPGAGGIAGLAPPMMGGMGNPWLSPNTYNSDFELEPFGIETQAKQFNAQQDMLDLAFDPRMGMLTTLSNPQAPGFDLGSLMSNDNPYLPGSGGASSSSGYDSGGSSGYDSGGQEVYTTDTLDALSNSTNPLFKGIFEDISAGMDPATKKANLLEAIPDPAMRDIAFKAVDDSFEELSGYRRNQLQNEQQGTSQQPSELQDWAAQWGLGNVMEGYGPGNWPTEMSGRVNQFMPDYSDAIEKQNRLIKLASPQAEYGPVGPAQGAPGQVAEGAPIPSQVSRAANAAGGGMRGQSWGGPMAGVVPYKPTPGGEDWRVGATVGDEASHFDESDQTHPIARAASEAAQSISPFQFAGPGGAAAMAARPPVDRSSPEYTMPYVIDKPDPFSGQYRTNWWGTQVADARDQADAQRYSQVRDTDAYQQLIGQMLAQSGRSQAGDMMTNRFNQMRQMGLGI